MYEYISTPKSVGVSITERDWRFGWQITVFVPRELIHFPLIPIERETVTREGGEAVSVLEQQKWWGLRQTEQRPQLKGMLTALLPEGSVEPE